MKDHNDPGTVELPIGDPAMLGQTKYERRPADFYPTPAWITECILRHVRIGPAWECAAGKGAMFDVIKDAGIDVIGTDAFQEDPRFGKFDFLKWEAATARDIITNAPFKLAEEFIRHSLKLTKTHRRKTVMILRTDFDTAVTRRDLFEREPFALKLIFLKRPQWIEGPLKASPRFSYAAYVWDWNWRGPAEIRYDK